MKIRKISCLALTAVLAVLCLTAAADDGDWNYVLLPDGSARVTRYVGEGAAPAVPETVDGYTVSQAVAGISGPLPGGVARAADRPEATGTTEEGYVYALHQERRTAEILGYTSDAERLILPRQIGGYPVTRIAEDAFSGDWRVTHVLLPDGLLEIGARAFSDCRLLEQVHFDRELLLIDEDAFAGCASLERISLPKSLLCIGARAFRATALTRASVPEGTEVVGESAFDEIPTLSYVRLGENVRVIERRAFAEATLRRMKLPESVVRVGRLAFAKTAWLSAENAALKAVLPDMELTFSDLSSRDWPDPLPEEPMLSAEPADLAADAELAAASAVNALRDGGGATAETAPASQEPRSVSESAASPEEATATQTAEAPGDAPRGGPDAGSAYEESTEDAPDVPYVRVTATRAKLRATPGMGGTLLRYAEQGETFPYVGIRKKWVGLLLPDGTEAYVAPGMVEVVRE